MPDPLTHSPFQGLAALLPVGAQGNGLRNSAHGRVAQSPENPNRIEHDQQKSRETRDLGGGKPPVRSPQ